MEAQQCVELTGTNCPFGLTFGRRTLDAASSFMLEHLPPKADSILVGGDSTEDPPVPIPNTEVKLQYADGTAGEARWESRSPPAIPYAPASSRMLGLSAFWDWTSLPPVG